ncbi:protein CLT2, chloroplastic-like isoform X2 [Actinidia eriantha]|uniref:protein CLT2, chloroplastic-like isoform X2 n=1 Tax=Actinidia eriantha TaxID=165200 RepID=UPI00258B5F40|nr:protein CLT2, chloroplastic-like isoform X2 [Actinidia eriantha]
MKEYPFFLAQVTTFGGSDAKQMLSGIDFVWPMLMIASSAFQASASILKESVFVDAATRLKGKLLDIFVVNSFGSGFQALFVLLFLPFLSNMKGIPFSQLPLYIKSGAGCFFNIGVHTLVPISIYILSLPLPYLPEGVSLSSFFLFGSMILVVGLLLYNVPQPVKQSSKID